MKTYLTPQEFSKLFFEEYDRRYASITYGPTDSIIHRMMQEFGDEIGKTLEGAIYGINA